MEGRRAENMLGDLKEFPPDLAFIVIITVLTVFVAIAPFLSETPLRIVLAVVFVVFAPGYALVSLLFPEKYRDTEELESRRGLFRRGGEVTGLERLAFSIGLSIIIVPFLGYILNFTPWRLRLEPLLIAVGGFTVISAVVASVRRLNVKPEYRFRVPYKDWIESFNRMFLEPDTRIDLALNILVALGLLVLISSLVFAFTVPRSEERFSEFYILTEGGNEVLIASGYPTNFTVGESRPIIVGIDNHEYRRTSYEVVIELQEVNSTNNTTSVLNERELIRYNEVLNHNETSLRTVNLEPELTGEQLRLMFLLYKESAPMNTSRENAYESLHLWVDVHESNQTSAPNSTD